MSVADLNSRMDDVVALIDAGDYALAFPKLIAAKAMLSGMPDSAKGSASLRWDRAAIDELIKTVERQMSVSTAAGRNSRGVIRQNVVYKRVRGSGSDC
jgi:hypothetical protein